MVEICFSLHRYLSFYRWIWQCGTFIADHENDRIQLFCHGTTTECGCKGNDTLTYADMQTITGWGRCRCGWNWGVNKSPHTHSFIKFIAHHFNANRQKVNILSKISICVVNLLFINSKTSDERYFYWTTILYEYIER